jgi:pyruvate/2-oxoglutarate dehydrogenase complex dihydrolipoamide dehydrogenase (E3) component
MSAREVDVVVVGVGTSGEDLSLRLLRAGLDVVGIEAALVGGECPYWACIPSKIMVRASNLLKEARRVNGVAGQAEVVPEWGPVAERVTTEATGGWDDSIAVQRFTDHGGRLIHGRAKLTGPNTVEVGDEIFEARRGIVIATGSRPSIPPIPGLADVGYWTTHDAIAALELPGSLAILGGGSVGCELGQIFARFGVKITIIEGRERLLPLEEPEASQVVAAAFEEDGIEVITGAMAEQVERGAGGVTISLAGGRTVLADHLLVATGRTVDLSGLGLESAGIDAGGGFIQVDDTMRAAKGVWAMGDVTGKAMFTHVALHQGAIVAADILGESPEPARYDAVPRVTFTDPEVGAVGMTEAEARAAGVDPVVATKQLPGTFRGWLHGVGSQGVMKLIVDRETGTLLGATTVGPSGGEMLSMLTLAAHAGIPLSRLRSMIYAFPTFHGAIGEAIGAYGRGLGPVLDPGYTGIEALDEVTSGG